jgi:hypothetical protein
LNERFLETLQRIPIKIPSSSNNQVASGCWTLQGLAGPKGKVGEGTDIFRRSFVSLEYVSVCYGVLYKTENLKRRFI